MRRMAPLLIGLFLLFTLSTGCITNGFGDVIYEDSAFQIQIGDDVPSEEVLIQITIFRIEGIHQKEESLVIERRKVTPSEGILMISAPLSEGAYKAHMIIFSEDKRIAGRIIDFKVSLA